MICLFLSHCLVIHSVAFSWTTCSANLIEQYLASPPINTPSSRILHNKVCSDIPLHILSFSIQFLILP
uniref:Putative secreted protein n=1 Tax=Panstrongylus lignarius TaxID=156445 RepID=A0A224Y755_9HEMI